MKKLLGFLGAITFIASTSTSVIACGNKEITDPATDENVFEELFKNFENDIQNSLNSHYSEKSLGFSVMNDSVEEKGFTFLKESKLTEVGNGDHVLEGENLNSFNHDLNLLLDDTALRIKINALANQPEYNLLTSGLSNGIYNGLIIKDNKIGINIKSGNENNTDAQSNFSATVSFSIAIDINYMKNNELQRKNSDYLSLTFSLINNEDISEAINDIQLYLGEELYKSANSPLFLTDSKLGIADYAFKEDIKDDVREYTNKSSSSTQGSFKNQIAKVTKEILDEKSTVSGSQVIANEQMSTENILWEKQYAKFNATNAKAITTKSDIYNKILVNKDPNITSAQKEEVIKNEYNKQLDDTNFKKSFETFIKARGFSSVESKTNFESVLGFGTLNIGGLQIKVADDIYEIPTIVLGFDYSVENDDNSLFKRSDYSKQILNSMEAFRSSFDISYSDDAIMNFSDERVWVRANEIFKDNKNDFSRSQLNYLIGGSGFEDSPEYNNEIAKNGKMGYFNFYLNSSARFLLTEEGIKYKSGSANGNKLCLQLGVFFIEIRFNSTDNDLLSKNGGFLFKKGVR
ncbi:lipoprotein [Spiroplasma endosymbiont of Cantharis nigra]|uniref:lipoprotein n=1 Tax=Spiroplasma endosymbiont of Cantharis nigra TaxID=3066278 RepID=UPI0030D19A08